MKEKRIFFSFLSFLMKFSMKFFVFLDSTKKEVYPIFELVLSLKKILSK